MNHPTEWRLETADDLKAVLELIVTQLLDAEDLDLGVKARNLSSLLSVGIKLIETADLEQRIAALESRLLRC